MKASEVIKKMVAGFNAYTEAFATSLEPEAASVPVADWYLMNVTASAQGESWFRIANPQRRTEQ